MISRIPGFHKLSSEERLEKIAKEIKLSPLEKRIIRGEEGFTVQDAEQMIENVVGLVPIPLGIATNFKVNGKDVFVPMATEEPSVVAAASHAAKFTYHDGGFTTTYTGSIMRGQIQIININHPYSVMAKIYEHKDEILTCCNNQDPTLLSLGGGAKDLEVHVMDIGVNKTVIVHLFIDTKDAMGANAVNTMSEAASSLIGKITGGQTVLCILSNLADRRIVRARATFENPFKGDQQLLQKFISAYQLAIVDSYRAATHNKGIMNGISAVALATGNDTRAIEAGAHAYAARSGKYQSLTHWEIEQDNIVGTIELPLAVGLVGGATQSHPVTKLALKIIHVQHAEQLAGIIASVGLAQNFAAIRALVSEGIQKGHMKLHVRNMAIMAGVKETEINQVIEQAVKQNTFLYDEIKQIIDTLRQK